MLNPLWIHVVRVQIILREHRQGIQIHTTLVKQVTYPHRVGRRSRVAVHLTDTHEKSLDTLITVTGNTLWPNEAEFRGGLRWNICAPDTTDLQ